MFRPLSFIFSGGLLASVGFFFAALSDMSWVVWQSGVMSVTFLLLLVATTGPKMHE